MPFGAGTFIIKYTAIINVPIPFVFPSMMLAPSPIHCTNLAKVSKMSPISLELFFFTDLINATQFFNKIYNCVCCRRRDADSFP